MAAGRVRRWKIKELAGLAAEGARREAKLRLAEAERRLAMAAAGQKKGRDGTGKGGVD